MIWCQDSHQLTLYSKAWWISYPKSTVGRLDDEGALDGMDEGIADGIDEGILDGIDEGILDGIDEGLLDGIDDGMLDGMLDGIDDGTLDGIDDGMLDGIADGTLDGLDEGMLEGMDEGPFDGADEGAAPTRPAAPATATAKVLSISGDRTSSTLTDASLHGDPRPFIPGASHRPAADRACDFRHRGIWVVNGGKLGRSSYCVGMAVREVPQAVSTCGERASELPKFPA